MKKAYRRGIAALVLLVALGGGGWYFRDRLRPAEAPQLLTAAATLGDIEQTVLANGQLKPARLVAVGAQASGRVTSLPVQLGQVVKQGDLIAEIDSMTQQNSLRTAEANLANIRAQRDQAAANLVLAEQTLARQRLTLSQRATSQADYDSAQASLMATRAQIASLDAQIAAAQVAVETARVNLGYTRITAPIDGTVLAIVTQQGQTVNANTTTPTMVVLGDVSTMTIIAEISEADVVNVRPGQDVFFNILGDPRRRIRAQLGSIDPAPQSITSDSSISSASSSGVSSSSSSSSGSSSQAIYYYGRFDVPNPEGRLRTYMTAQVNIVLGRAQGVVTIPSSALVRGQGGQQAVRVQAEDGSVSVRQVQVGLNNRIRAEIRSGLAEGERVVTGDRAASGASGGFRPPPRMGL
jgi:macrolide-specific efflux system membrane fusion protein